MNAEFCQRKLHHKNTSAVTDIELMTCFHQYLLVEKENKFKFLIGPKRLLFSVLSIGKKSKQILNNIWWKKFVDLSSENSWTHVVSSILIMSGEKSPKLAALSLYFTSEVMLSYAGTHPLAVVYTNKEFLISNVCCFNSVLYEIKWLDVASAYKTREMTPHHSG